MNNPTTRVVVILIGGIPLFVVENSWSRAAMIAYLSTAFLFDVLLVGELPRAGSSAFRKSLSSIVFLHTVLISGLVAANLMLPEMNKLPRVVYGFVSLAVALEYWVSLRIIGFCSGRTGPKSGPAV